MVVRRRYREPQASEMRPWGELLLGKGADVGPKDNDDRTLLP